MKELWRTSNVNNAMYMENEWCCKCERDRAVWEHNRPEEGCQIAAMMYAEGQHEAWIVENGEVKCTEFMPEGVSIKKDNDTIDMFEEAK